MGKGKGIKTYIGEDGQLHPVICGVSDCQNPVKDNQEKYCCDACRKRAMTLRSMDTYKGVYKDFDGWAGGPRGLGSVESSIKTKENNGYNAVVLSKSKKLKNLSKSQSEFFK